MSSERDHLDFVQGLRGIASFMIVVFHLKWYMSNAHWLGLGERVLGNAHTGVDLFFVISGFIMVHASRRCDGSARSAAVFLVRRFARIWPVYAVTTVLFLLAMGTLFDVHGGKLVRALAFLPEAPRGAPFFEYPPLHVGWTLVYEAYFYVLFAVALLAGRWRWALLGALAGITLIALPQLATGDVSLSAFHDYKLHPAILDIVASPMVWEFLAGVVIGLVYHSRLRLRPRPLRLTFVWLAIAVVVWQYGTGFHAGHGPVASGAAIAVMVLALAMFDKEERIRVPAWLMWLGNVSFSLYLVHRFPQLALPPLLKASHPQLVTGGGFVAFCIITGLLLAYLSHRYLEQGLAEWVRRVLVDKLRRR
jgi:peptidoglycan/LPS O-acetylase OafA/YrhL